MANLEVRNARMIVKNDTAANWAVSTLVPLKGEMCLESNTNKFKFGDGINTFANLPYAGTLGTDDIAEGSTNLYYTDARVATKVGTMNTTDMADGATVLHTTDTIVFDCGNSGVSAS